MREQNEKRKFPRVKINNLLSYICIDENNWEADHGVGRALDISQAGLLLESRAPIESEKILLTTVTEQNELLDIKGRVAYCREVEPKIFTTGVQFLENKERIREIVVNMIKIYNLEKNS
jgi:hypothetical protein